MIAFVAIAAIDLLYLFCEAYPGTMTVDSFNTMQQIIEGPYHNTMPYWHTMTVEFFYRIGMALFHDINAAMALYVIFQILFMAAGFAYALTTLYQIGIPQELICVAFLIYALAPYHVRYSVTHWKDVLFGGAALVLVTAMYRILKHIGKNSKWNYINFAIGALCLSVWRTNGWYVFALTTLILVILFRKYSRSLIWLACGISVLGWILIGPVLTALQVEKTDMIEALSIPLQQIALVISDGESTFTPEEESLLKEAFDFDIAEAKYDPYISNSIKLEALRRENLPFMTENLGRYVKLWVQLGLRYPSLYLRAWIEQTKGYWNGGYEYWIYASGVTDNSYGIYKMGGDNIISTCFRKVTTVFENLVIFRPVVSIGLHVWILVCCFCVNLIQRRKEELMLTVPILIIIVGLWIGTPVYSEFRYAYPLFTTYPFLMGVTFFESGGRRKNL